MREHLRNCRAAFAWRRSGVQVPLGPLLKPASLHVKRRLRGRTSPSPFCTNRYTNAALPFGCAFLLRWVFCTEGVFYTASGLVPHRGQVMRVGMQGHDDGSVRVLC
jgi:hypothetical protein